MEGVYMKKFICGIVTGAVIATAIGAGAVGVWDNIPVLRNDIKIVVDGQEIQSDNFLYNDTTYVPLRAVSSALGEEVEYDEAQNTAYIGERKDNMNNENVVGKYTPTDEETKACLIYNNTFYINVGYFEEKYVYNSGKFQLGWDSATQTTILHDDKGELGRWKCVVMEDGRGYVPYDTFVDEILPLLK